jgi:hypothetical protein
MGIRPRNRETIITKKLLMSVLDYCPESGVFTWKVRAANRIEVSDVAGSKNHYGYITIMISNKNWRAHRLAFLYMEGAFPAGQVDHINGVYDDNRWVNLRVVDNQTNARNQKQSSKNTSGVTGVAWSRAARKWQASIVINGRPHYLGVYDDLSVAASVRRRAEREHGFHANHGRKL